MRSWRAALATTLTGLITTSVVVVALPGTAFAGPNEGDMFSAVNATRANAGLPAYSYASDLAAAARGQAERMAASGELYHNPNLGNEVGGWSRIGENVAYAGDWRSAHDVLMNSAEHRAQILDSGYTQMGVGTAVDKNGTFWVAEVFRTPSGASTPSTSGGGGATSETTSTRTGTTSTYVPSTAPPALTAEQLLRQSIRDAREKVAARSKARHSDDPIVSALDYSTVMETLSG
ncbi:MAG TPA: CAP domain-containing protein [Actinomycetes bacterium]|nr:CAP domain-containing protein [Actinomycetes bacterium]